MTTSASRKTTGRRALSGSARRISSSAQTIAIASKRARERRRMEMREVGRRGERERRDCDHGQDPRRRPLHKTFSFLSAAGVIAGPGEAAGISQNTESKRQRFLATG